MKIRLGNLDFASGDRRCFIFITLLILINFGSAKQNVHDIQIGKLVYRLLRRLWSLAILQRRFRDQRRDRLLLRGLSIVREFESG